jgi:hypothetical protein
MSPIISKKMSKSEFDDLERREVERDFVRISTASLMINCSESYIKSLIINKKINSYLPSPKVRLIEVASLISYIKNNTEVR